MSGPLHSLQAVKRAYKLSNPRLLGDFFPLVERCNQTGLACLIHLTKLDVFHLHLRTIFSKETLFSLEDNETNETVDHIYSPLFYSLGANLYSSTIGHSFRENMLRLAYGWILADFMRLSARQRQVIVKMLLVFKRFGIQADVHLKIRLVRSYLCADHCYQKHAYSVSRLERSNLKTAYMSIIDLNISSPHIRSSRAHQEYCVAHHAAERDVFRSLTICDTTHDPQASSMAIRVRMAYLNKDYRRLNTLFGFTNDEERNHHDVFFYDNLFQKKQTHRLHQYCGKELGHFILEIHPTSMAILSPLDVESIQFIINMTRYSGNWVRLDQRFRAYALWDDWSEQYAMAVGKQWSLTCHQLEKIWFNWAPDSCETYTFDFIYRARPLLHEKSPFPKPIAQLIVHWLAAATYINRIKEYDGWTKAKMAQEMSKYGQRLKAQGAIPMQMAFAERMKLIRLLKL